MQCSNSQEGDWIELPAPLDGGGETPGRNSVLFVSEAAIAAVRPICSAARF